MDVKLFVVLCFLVVIGGNSARRIGSKPTDTDYGPLEGDVSEEKDGVQNDDYYDEDTEDGKENSPQEDNNTVKEPAPKITSQSQRFYGVTGKSVILPCQVSTKDYVMIWEKEKENLILFQGGLALQKKDNVRQLENGSLEILIQSPSDLGEYTCKIIGYEGYAPQVTHKIIHGAVPKINAVTADRNILSPGDTLNLRCNASGDPKPQISWHKGNERLGTEGESITIPNIKFKNAGVYRCLAVNEVGPPAHGHISIFVNHKPIVTIEKYIVTSDKESDAELKCTVHAYPAPVVLWQRDGQNIVEIPGKVILTRHQDTVENILTIKNLEESDFGKYTCKAGNGLGQVEHSIKLVKTPAVREFQKPQKGSKDVVLTWKVESKSPISAHELEYRKKGAEEWVLLKPEVTNGKNDIYTVTHTLSKLDPGSYETRVRSQNIHGWSDYSDIMPFEGVLAKHGSHHKHNKKQPKQDAQEKQISQDETPAEHQETPVAAVGASATDSSSAVTSSVGVLSISVLLLLFHSRH